MIEGIEELYTHIGNDIVDAIPENWTTAKVESIFYPDTSLYFGEYVRSIDGIARSLSFDSNIDRVFRQLRSKFKEAGHPLWGRACFEIHADGKFNMKWDYDDCDENGDARYDEEEESKRYHQRHKRLSSS